MKDADWADDLELLANIPAQAKSVRHSLEQAAGVISLYVNTNKRVQIFQTKRSYLHTKFQASKINGFVHISNISYTENGVNICLEKTWNAIDRLSILWKFDLFDNIKRDFFQAVAVSIRMQPLDAYKTHREKN